MFIGGVESEVCFERQQHSIGKSKMQFLLHLWMVIQAKVLHLHPTLGRRTLIQKEWYLNMSGNWKIKISLTQVVIQT